MKAGGQVRTTIIKFTLVIPFTGSPELLCEALPVLAPQTALFGQFVKVNDDRPQLSEIDEGALRLYCNDTADIARAKAYFDVQLNLIEQRLISIRAAVEAHNHHIADMIPRAVARRRAEVLADRSSYASIGFPIKHRADAESYRVPVTRKKITLGRVEAHASGSPYLPEPALADTDYEAVLDVLRHARNALERAPSTASKLHEEEIRDLILICGCQYYSPRS